FSYPRCSAISSVSAVSSTFLVNSLSSPPGPVSSRPRCRASATIAAAAARSGDSRRSSLLPLLCAFTASDVITHSAHPAGPQPGVPGRKHRFAAQSLTYLCLVFGTGGNAAAAVDEAVGLWACLARVPAHRLDPGSRGLASE